MTSLERRPSTQIAKLTVAEAVALSVASFAAGGAVQVQSAEAGDFRHRIFQRLHQGRFAAILPYHKADPARQGD